MSDKCRLFNAWLPSYEAESPPLNKLIDTQPQLLVGGHHGSARTKAVALLPPLLCRLLLAKTQTGNAICLLQVVPHG